MFPAQLSVWLLRKRKIYFSLKISILSKNYFRSLQKCISFTFYHLLRTKEGIKMKGFWRPWVVFELHRKGKLEPRCIKLPFRMLVLHLQLCKTKRWFYSDQLFLSYLIIFFSFRMCLVFTFTNSTVFKFPFPAFLGILKLQWNLVLILGSRVCSCPFRFSIALLVMKMKTSFQRWELWKFVWYQLFEIDSSYEISMGIEEFLPANIGVHTLKAFLELHRWSWCASEVPFEYWLLLIL